MAGRSSICSDNISGTLPNTLREGLTKTMARPVRNLIHVLSYTNSESKAASPCVIFITIHNC